MTTENAYATPRKEMQTFALFYADEPTKNAEMQLQEFPESLTLFFTELLLKNGGCTSYQKTALVFLLSRRRLGANI